MAENFLHAEEIYFPHSVDYRGRAYPVPPHLNHNGDDISRGLLQFAEGKICGTEGLRWLNISCANLYGMDKLNFDRREKWAYDNREKMLQCATDPFEAENLKWWVAAEDPWQFLARCFEMKDAYQLPDPAQFCSYLPVHMDGSCNGLQHYAALGLDEWGARSVNLLPGDEVQDVYVEVLNLIIKCVEKDAKLPGNAIQPKLSKGELARLAIDYKVLERKTVKQTVMTICYGVTHLGAQKQVSARLTEKIGSQLDPHTVRQLANYLSRTLLNSVSEVFKHAMEIKKWFDEVSRLFNKTGAAVCWISPLGFAIRQPYYESTTRVVQTALQSITLAEEGCDGDKIKKASQRSGFPPNFIHSLDASHMCMSAERMFSENLQFAAVHDSFWTHACDVSRMNVIIRETFLEMYSEPILQDLDADIRTRLGYYADELPPLPERGKLKLELVMDSPYFFD